MSILILNPGLQTTLQSAPRTSLRHQGVPASGAADPLSLALANRLLENPLLLSGLETALSGVRFRVTQPVSFAVTGAMADCTINGHPLEQHAAVQANAGDEIAVGAAQKGARSYVAFRGGLSAESFLGSGSTYLPAGFGGHAGRALMKGDEITLLAPSQVPALSAPVKYHLAMRRDWTLRAGNSGETELLDDPAALFTNAFSVSNRSDRMGVRLDGPPLALQSDGRMQSSAVFPGVVQCPEDGRPYLLGVDAQTTGGYPRIAKVARLDLHMLGQLRPGDKVKLLFRDEATAADELQQKQSYWRDWLGDLTHII